MTGSRTRAWPRIWSLLVIDGGYGFGNGRVHAGGAVARADAARGLARADAVVLMGEDETGIAGAWPARPVLRARARAG